MKSLPTAKKAVKRIPRAPKTPMSTFAIQAATELRKFIRANIRECPGRLSVLADLAKAVPGRIDFADVIGGEVEPDQRERDYQNRVLASAAMHFAVFHSMLAGLVETGPYPITWADGWPALTLLRTAEYAADCLKELQHIMQCMGGGATASEIESRIKAKTGVT